MDLLEKTEVEVLLPEKIAGDEDDPTGWRTMMELKGCIKGAAPDIAENHDKHLTAKTNAPIDLPQV